MSRTLPAALRARTAPRPIQMASCLQGLPHGTCPLRSLGGGGLKGEGVWLGPPPPPRVPLWSPPKGGGSRGGRGVWLGPPSSEGRPTAPAEGGPRIIEASILLAPKAPTQHFGCQPQTLEGEEEGGGGQGGNPPSSDGVGPF